MTSQQQRAEVFGELHRGRILVVPNCWDAASAKMFEAAGAHAVATTSSGVAATFGYPDGEHVPRDLLVTMVRRITATVDIPVSVDLEEGYGTTPRAVCDTVTAIIDAGAVGINIEDGLHDAGVLIDKIAAIRELVAARGLGLFINARTDLYLRPADLSPVARLGEAVRRLLAYEAAGADGLFVPGLRDAETIRNLLGEIHRPLNVLAGAGTPAIGELERLGVRRVSVGGGPQRAAMALARRVAEELLHQGTYSSFLTGAPSHTEVNRLFADRT